jgi:hypothetical protein
MNTKPAPQVCKLCGVRRENIGDETRAQCPQAFTFGRHIWMVEDERTAEQAYVAKHDVAVRIAERILEHLKNHDDSPDPDHINWSHVGDIDDTVVHLRAVADRLFHEGEYALEAKA